MLKPPFGLSLDEALTVLDLTLSQWMTLEALSGEQAARLSAAKTRLSTGEPLAYVVGWAPFMGMRLAVGPGVLIPRPETEEWLTDWLATEPLPEGARVLDVGTGSGAIAMAVKKARPDTEVWAVDISQAALAWARQNTDAHGLAVHFCLGDGPAAAPPPFHWVLSNPPYIGRREKETLASSLSFEPPEALFSGEDGVDFCRMLIKTASEFLQPGGVLAMEIGPGQGTLIQEAFPGAGLEIWRDEAGRERRVSMRAP